MALQNPIAGGPDFVKSLRNALEKTPGGYASPPPTGGTQVSVRFSDDRLAILDGVCKYSGWNRNQVINAFVDRGLFELFQYIGDKAVDNIMSQAAARLIPTYDPSETVMKDITSYNRFRIFPYPQLMRQGELPLPLEDQWVIQHVDRERDTVTFMEATQAGHSLPPLHTQHIERVCPDTAEDATNGVRNAMVELNVQVVLTSRGPQLIPAPEQSALIKPQKR